MQRKPMEKNEKKNNIIDQVEDLKARAEESVDRIQNSFSPQVREGIIREFKQQVGDTIYQNLKPIEVQLLNDISTDAAIVHQKSLMGQDVEVEIKHINAQLLNLAAARIMNVKKVFWLSFARAVNFIATNVVKAALVAIV